MKYSQDFKVRTLTYKYLKEKKKEGERKKGKRKGKEKEEKKTENRSAIQLSWFTFREHSKHIITIF